MSRSGAAPPNIVWIFGDQHRGQCAGYAGDANVRTPNLDRMATEGVCCLGALSGFPLCCPARATILTGRYAHNTVRGHEHRLDPEIPTVAGELRRSGYHTAWFGKWHLDGFQEREGRAAHHIIPPERRGAFDAWVGYENNNSQWDCWVHGGEGDGAFHRRLPGYETDALTELFIDHLRQQRPPAQPSRPFFMALSVQPPHDPYVAPEEWMRRHHPSGVQFRPNVPPVQTIRARAARELAGYHAMVENLDWNVGRVMQALDETGLRDSTIVIFFSDHGDMHGSHGQFRKTCPHEEAIRVPWIVWGRQPFYGPMRHGRNHIPVSLADLAPTTLGLCGLPPAEGMAGRDLSGLFDATRPGPDLPDSAYLQLVIPTGHGHSHDRSYRGLVTADGWKYVSHEGHPWLLHDLNEDPYELANHAFNPAYHSERRRLHERLRQWIADTGDEFRL
jgi:arylsulfatase A-like enzyme